MRDGPTEVNFDLDNLTIANGEALRITEGPAAGTFSLVGNDHIIARFNHADKIKASDELIIRPAALEIGSAVQAVVVRAGEMKIVSNEVTKFQLTVQWSLVVRYDPSISITKL